MTSGRRPATTPHHCHICGDHIWLRGSRNGWQHLNGGRHNHPAYHKVDPTTPADTTPPPVVA